mgnify:FL=1
MTPRIERLKRHLQEHRHHVFRREVEWKLAEQFAKQNLPPFRRVSEALAEVLKAETPVFLPEERIAFTRTLRTLPELYTEEEVRKMRSEFSFAEKGVVFNLCCDFASTIAVGLDARRAEVAARMNGRDNAFLSAVLLEIDAILDLAERYRREAEQTGCKELASLLSRVPRTGAETFHEALQFFRILHYTLWCEGEYHNGIGRFDQYMLPYLERDLAFGRETEESAFELLEEFFLSFHRDSDLYIGVQQGDNGQSMVLGGCGRDGNESSNRLTRMCLRASKELAVIDPKINLRVSKETPRELFELGTELTAAGLGFPQYSNDDVVIPALCRWGYSLEDARNYVVAACWEFTIPGCGMDVPNIDAVSLPAMLLETLAHSNAATFAELMAEYAQTLRVEAVAVNAKYRNFTMLPGPFASLLCDGCIKRGRDISEGGKYNNFGVHGTGISTAVDSLAALEQLVFDEKKVSLEAFRKAIADNFVHAPELLAAVRNTVPKLGSGDGKTEGIARQLFVVWSEAWQGLRNIRGGIWRPGTGSAMFYIRHAQSLSATPDGRLAGEPFPANYAPSLTVPQTGPVSVIRDFAGAVIPEVCNGGPLTIELHDSVFREPDGIGKAASLVQLFCKNGGHQLQLNAIDRDTLLDAQNHPEFHRDLIVRVWGWSGYFVELDKVFQDHIIRRTGLSFP